MYTELKVRLASILKNHFLVETSGLRSWKYLDDLGITQPEKKELLNLFEDEFQIIISEKTSAAYAPFVIQFSSFNKIWGPIPN